MNQTKVCTGCGAILQITDETQIGFVKSLSHDLCIRCFKLKHYGIDINQNGKENAVDIKPDSLIVHIISVLDLDHLFLDNLRNLGSNLSYLYIINQCDLLPKETLKKLEINVYQKAKELHITFLDIIYMSAISKNDIDELTKYLKKLKFKNIYLHGAQNSGKTTIVNALTNSHASTGLKAGLTHQMMSYDWQTKTIHDLPGIKRMGRIEDILEYQVYKKILPNKTLKPKNYQIDSNQYLSFENLFKVHAKSKGTMICYFNDHTLIKRNNTRTFHDEQMIETTFKVDDHTQISLSNLGFIHTKDIGHITVRHQKGLNVHVFRRLF